jgi:hypothetical protein
MAMRRLVHGGLRGYEIIMAQPGHTRK